MHDIDVITVFDESCTSIVSDIGAQVTTSRHAGVTQVPPIVSITDHEKGVSKTRINEDDIVILSQFLPLDGIKLNPSI